MEMEKMREEFYSILMDTLIERDERERIASIIDESIRRITDIHLNPKGSELMEYLSMVAKAMLRGDFHPIRELAGYMLGEEISLPEVGKLMFRILKDIGRNAWVDERTRIALEKMAFAFIVTLSSEMNDLFYRAVQRATGMSDELLRRFVRSQTGGPEQFRDPLP